MNGRKCRLCQAGQQTSHSLRRHRLDSERSEAESSVHCKLIGRQAAKPDKPIVHRPGFEIINDLMHDNLRKMLTNIFERWAMEQSHGEKSTFSRCGVSLRSNWALRALHISVAFLVQVFAISAQNAGSFSNALPSRIITTDGITYNGPKLLNVAPDGLVIEYLLDSGGTGMAKLKFAKLADLLQKRFGYDPKKALSFETEQSKLMTALVEKEQLEQVQRAEVRLRCPGHRILLQFTQQTPQ